MNQKIIVTYKDNVFYDEAGQLETNDEGDVLFKDAEALGHLIEVSAFPHPFVDTEGQTHIGFITRAQVCWEHKRTPAVAFEDLSDLAWISFNAPELDEESQDSPENIDEEESQF